MTKTTNGATQFKNAESPFTELFLLLKRPENVSQKFLPLKHSAAQLRIIQQHSDNAMVMLYQGLQDLGNMMGSLSNNKTKKIKGINTIGFFISGISNLTEALNTLRLDAEYQLQQY